MKEMIAHVERITPFTNCRTVINNTQADNVKELNAAMSMYNLIEHSDNYSKTYESLHQFCRDEPNDNIADFK